MRVDVRRGAPEDAAGIARIHVRTWQAAYRGLVPDDVLDGLSVAQREVAWRKMLGDPDGSTITFVAEREGHVVGFCALAAPSRDEDALERTAEVGAIYVDPSTWRKGVGRALMDAALDELRVGHWSAVSLWVLAENTAARAFHAHYGFQPDGAELLHELSGQKEVRLRASLKEG
jgi:GNAT superfamily N-acetyltransferase